MYVAYKDIPTCLEQEKPFYGNTMSASNEIISWKMLPLGRATSLNMFEGHTFRYVVYSYQTPIAGVTTDGEILIPPVRYSRTTSRHQGLLHHLHRT